MIRIVKYNNLILHASSKCVRGDKKYCRGCGEWLEFEFFNIYKIRGKNTFYCYCAPCESYKHEVFRRKKGVKPVETMERKFIVIDGIDYLKCTQCKEVKVAVDFSNDRSNRINKSYRCKACAREHTKKWRAMKHFSESASTKSINTVTSLGRARLIFRRMKQYTRPGH